MKSLLAVLLLVLACGKSDKREVVVYTSVDQVFAEPVLRAFESKTGVHVRAVYDTEETKSTGVLNRLLAEASTPRADVFWSGDPVRPFALITRGLVQPYVSPAARDIPATFKAADGTWTGFSARARVLLVNTKVLGTSPRPRSLRDLADPRWKGQVAVASPVFGTTTTHVAALFTAWGDERSREFLAALQRNDVRVASSNGEVKRLVASGQVAFGLTDTDDANEAIKDGAPVEVVYPDQDGEGTFLMPTTVVVIRGGPHPDGARALVDFLLTPEVEGMLAASAAQMPLRAGVSAPPGVRDASTLKTMQVDYQAVATTMERIQPWLREWAGL